VAVYRFLYLLVQTIGSLRANNVDLAADLSPEILGMLLHLGRGSDALLLQILINLFGWAEFCNKCIRICLSLSDRLGQASDLGLCAGF
jgi:hypothetical protein